MLLQTGKTIKEIAKFADLEVDAITQLARTLDLEPATPAQRRGKELYASDAGHTYQEIAKQLAAEGHTGDDDGPMHHLTVASWVRNYGWAWGGAADGAYAPEKVTRPAARSRYVLRLSKTLDAEINAPGTIKQAAEAAWTELASDSTRVVQLAVIRGAAKVGVTDLVEVKKQLLELHGEEIRTAKADD